MHLLSGSWKASGNWTKFNDIKHGLLSVGILTEKKHKENEMNSLRTEFNLQLFDGQFIDNVFEMMIKLDDRWI